MSPNWKTLIREFLLMTLGTAILSVGVYFFKFPNNFSIGGVSGLAILLGRLIQNPFFTSTVFNSIISLIFLFLGFAFLNKGFGFRTVYCTLLYTVLVQVLEWVCPLSAPLTGQRMLELFFAVLLPALGSGILFNLDASTGGTDIAAMILKKYSGLDVGMALLLSDVVIAAAALLIFNVETGLFSLFGLVIKSVIIDSVIESLNRRKSFMVITSNPEPVCDFVTHELVRGATVWEGKGAYTHQQHWVILTVLSRGQALALRRYLKAHDPTAFMLITNSSEIFGKGFLRA